MSEYSEQVLMDHRGKDQLHGQIELSSGNANGVGSAHETAVDH